MLWTEEAVRSNIRNREGKRVFFLGEGDRLTPGARDFLTAERIEVRPACEAPIPEYRLLCGGLFREKPEQLTHLRGDILVPKTHPVIAFRGTMDSLEGDIMLCQLMCGGKLQKELGELLTLTRNLIRWEVLEEPVPEYRLCGLTEDELRRHSHFPRKYYGIPHFMPDAGDGAEILWLNKCRTGTRQAELAAARAFTDRDGVCSRGDILQSLNRMSSMFWILMIRLKAEKSRGGEHGPA